MNLPRPYKIIEHKYSGIYKENAIIRMMTTEKKYIVTVIVAGSLICIALRASRTISSADRPAVDISTAN